MTIHTGGRLTHGYHTALSWHSPEKNHNRSPGDSLSRGGYRKHAHRSAAWQYLFIPFLPGLYTGAGGHRALHHLRTGYAWLRRHPGAADQCNARRARFLRRPLIHGTSPQLDLIPPVRLVDGRQCCHAVRDRLSWHSPHAYLAGAWLGLWLWRHAGTQGPNNALSPRYLNQAIFATITHHLPVLWIRGADDQIVSDSSLFDFGFLGQLGAVPGWPGPEVYPAQPMISQIRAVFKSYQANGGRYREVILPECGHSPHVEKQEEVLKLFTEFVESG